MSDAPGSMPIRRAGRRGGPVLWLIHALGDSSDAFGPLLESDLSRDFDLLAPDWPGTGTVEHDHDLAGLASWLRQTIAAHTPGLPVGFVGHSLGAAVAVKAVRRIERPAGLLSIEGNLTEADAYFSGQAADFDDPEEFRTHLMSRIGELTERATSSRRAALLRYRASLARTDARTLWTIGRAAKAASRGDALGEEYRTLRVPSLYLWSLESAPAETQAFIRDHRLRNQVIATGHWPMIEQPDATAHHIRAFFEPLFEPGPAPVRTPIGKSEPATTMPAPQAAINQASEGRAALPSSPPKPSPSGTAAPASATVTASARPRSSSGTDD
jgi:pimeloyl-ACP methyl ester carboxylesterase